MVTVAGCQHKAATLPAGAINSFDATSYDVLVTTQGAINGFKAQLPTLPASQQAIVKPALNQAIGYYNQAEIAWQDFHKGGATTSSALSAALGQLISSLGTIEQLIKGK